MRTVYIHMICHYKMTSCSIEPTLFGIILHALTAFTNTTEDSFSNYKYTFFIYDKK